MHVKKQTPTSQPNKSESMGDKDQISVFFMTFVGVLMHMNLGIMGKVKRTAYEATLTPTSHPSTATSRLCDPKQVI